MMLKHFLMLKELRARGMIMNDLLDRLVFKNNCVSMVEELKNAPYPIILYGGGSYARDVIKFLKNRDVTIDMIVADDVLPDIISDYGMKRLDYSEIDFSCYLVMGFAMYHKGKELAQNNPCIKKVFYPCLMPYDETERFDKESIVDMIDRYQIAYESLEDDFSRQCMASFLNARLNDDASFCFECYEGEQTYFSNSVYKAVPSENYLDVGAYTGDTIRLFIKTVMNPCGHIWAVEADESLKPRILEAIEEGNVNNITDLYFTGLWDSYGTVYFNHTSGNDEEGYISEYKSENGVPIEVDTLDNVLSERLQKVSLLKVNFSDAQKIIAGGKETIKKDKPKLAIVVGFGSDMIADIPLLIKKISSDYKVYLRYNSPMPARIVCYAV